MRTRDLIIIGVSIALGLGCATCRRCHGQTVWDATKQLQAERDMDVLVENMGTKGFIRWLIQRELGTPSETARPDIYDGTGKVEVDSTAVASMFGKKASLLSTGLATVMVRAGTTTPVRGLSARHWMIIRANKDALSVKEAEVLAKQDSWYTGAKAVAEVAPK